MRARWGERGEDESSSPLSPHLAPSAPAYLALGHVTVDRLPAGLTVGGSVAYATTTAMRLGVAAGMVTAAAEELDWPLLLPGVALARTPVQRTTTFENRYEGGRRAQRILALAEPIRPEAVPESWRSSPIVHLAPVVHEVNGAFPDLFPNSLVALTPQGLLRGWDRAGWVSPGCWPRDDALLAGSRVVVFSEEDVAGDPAFLSYCLDHVPVTVLTRGARGLTLYLGRQSRDIPAFPTVEVDPTGAGDVFAAAFLIEYHRTGDPYRSAAFGCCAASFAVERPGLQALPTREQVEFRLSLYQGGLRTED